jgi:putative spermidine/putrescine transport system permease protein
LANRLLAAFVVVFLFAPICLAAIVAFSSGDRLQFPIPGPSLRWFSAALSKATYIDGLVNSVIIASGDAVLATIAGTGAALAFNHYRFTGRSVVQTFVMLPMAMPGIVLGLGLLFTMSLYGMRPGVVATICGHAALTIPYVVAMVAAALSNYDRSIERASMNLGVGPIGTFFKITLPLIRGGITAGAVSAFLVSFDNLSLSLFISNGDTLPLRLMQQLVSNPDPSVAAMCTLLMVFSLLGLVLVLPLLWRGRAS